MDKSTKKLPLPPKPRRPRDANMRMASIMQDVIALSHKPVLALTLKKSKKRKGNGH